MALEVALTYGQTDILPRRKSMVLNRLTRLDIDKFQHISLGFSMGGVAGFVSTQ